MISITNRAAQKIQEISKEDKLEGQPIRLKIFGAGCAGMSFDLAFEEKELTSFDEVFEINNIKIVVDELTNSYLLETTIDYVENTNGSGFKITDKAFTKTCGCGSSFAP